MPGPSRLQRCRQVLPGLLLAALVAPVMSAGSAFADTGPAATPLGRASDRAVERVSAGAPVELRRRDVAPDARAGLLDSGTTAGPAADSALLTPHSTWNVTYSGFSTEARAAFQRAVDIWSAVVESAVPIEVEASFAPTDPGVLGYAGPTYLLQGASIGDGTSFYPAALANALTGTDRRNDRSDVQATFSSSETGIYYGTDGRPPTGSIDFVTVVLHELGHGLGFLGSMDVAGGSGSYGNPPIRYDRFAVDGAGRPLLEQPDDSAQLAEVLQSGKVFWAGAEAMAAAGGVRPRLFAPATWQSGSSYSHLDESTYPPGSTHALMTPYLSRGEVLRDPGSITRGLLRDQGWVTHLPPTAPTAPTGVSARPGDRSAVVSWAAAEPNGAPVTSYRVTAQPGSATVVVDGATTHATLAGLQNGTAYRFAVTATNGVGTGPPSASSAQVVPAPLPAQVEGVVAVAGDSRASVSWSPPGEGSDLTGYTVTASPGGGTVTTSDTIASIEGLGNGTGYAFVVRATNGSGTGPASDPSPTVVPAGVPRAPSSVTATPGDGSATVSWQAAADNGAAIAGYTVTAQPGGVTVDTDGTSAQVSGLTNGDAYRFTVTATNAVGTGPASPASTAVTPRAPSPVPDVDPLPYVPFPALPVPATPLPATSPTAEPTAGPTAQPTATPAAPEPAAPEPEPEPTAPEPTAPEPTAPEPTAPGPDAPEPTAPGPAAPVPAAPVPTAPDPAPTAPEPTTPSPLGPSSTPSARSIDRSCPAGLVPPDLFTDVEDGNPHRLAVSCLVWWNVAKGRTTTQYTPDAGVTRDAMAAFVARTILASGGTLPAAPPDAFSDDQDSVHQLAIDQLAAVGVVGGTGDGRYSPSTVVTRGQMARFLARAVEQATGAPLPKGPDYFPDDDGNIFEADIDQVARVGITGGRADGTYLPAGPVRRDQMGSFLARTLDLFVEQGRATVPVG